MYDPGFRNATQVGAGNTGYPNIDPALYFQMVRLFHDAAFHVSTHAVGDRAIDTVVDTYAAVLQDNPRKGLRHGIIHCNIPTDHAINTMARLQRDFDAGCPETQAPFLWWIGDLYASTFGAKRDARLMPHKTYVERHILWAGGSDVSRAVRIVVLGRTQDSQRHLRTTAIRNHRIRSIHTALKSYTIWAAHQLFLESRIGSLGPGKDADIAVWDRDPYTTPSVYLKSLKCESTLFRGRVVYRAPESAVSESAQSPKRV